GVIMYRVLKRVMRFQIDIKARDEVLTARIESLLAGAATVKAFGFGEPLRTSWGRLFWDRLGVDFRAMLWQKGGFLLIGPLQLAATFASLFYGVFLIERGTLTLGSLLAFLTVSGRITPNLTGLVMFFVGVQETLVGLERYYRVHDLPDEEIEFRGGALA